MSNVSVLFGKGPGKAGVKRHHKVLCDNIQVFSTAFKDSRTTPNEFSTTVYEFLKDIGNAFKAFATTNGVFRLFEFIASVFGSLKDIGIAFKAFPFIIYVFKTTVSLQNIPRPHLCCQCFNWLLACRVANYAPWISNRYHAEPM